jgi:methylenetetrahydrofolate dehydrogenase (NADP+)/methenyltetrahydrofolate cyclohydrolase
MILDGKKLSLKILKEIKNKIKKQLKLAVILVGNNKVSETYVKEKKNACKEVGIGFELFRFPLDINEEDLKKEVLKIAKDPSHSGVVIQLPLLQGFNVQEILNLIPPEKDIDALSEKSLYTSPIVKGVKRLLKEYNISIRDKNIVLIGKGRLVGRPLALWLEKEKADFSVIDKSVKDISSFTLKADIIISGVGKSHIITGDMIKQGAVIIDAGTSSEKGRSIGDVDFKGVSKKAGYITPVPKGIGPMTVACLLDNLAK